MEQESIAVTRMNAKSVMALRHYIVRKQQDQRYLVLQYVPRIVFAVVIVRFMMRDETNIPSATLSRYVMPDAAGTLAEQIAPLAMSLVDQMDGSGTLPLMVFG